MARGELSAAMAAALEQMWQAQDKAGKRQRFTAAALHSSVSTLRALEVRWLVTSRRYRDDTYYRITDKGVNWGADS